MNNRFYRAERSFVLSLLIFGGLCCVLNFRGLAKTAAASQSELPAFNEQLTTAYAYAVKREFAKAEKIFQDLLARNPQESIIYDAYVQALQANEEYDRALEILKKEEKQIPSRRESVQAKLAQIQAQKDFSKQMASAPAWDKARVIAAQNFVIQTNLPEQSIQTLIPKIQGLFLQEKKLVSEILDSRDALISDMKFLVIGRRRDYVAYMKEKFQNQIQIPAGLYDPVSRQMIIYFDGSTDWKVIAHEMTHSLIRELNYHKPSHFIDEGLAEYVSNKIEKNSIKSILSDNLEFMNWLYDQGELQSAFDLFTVWKDYERPKTTHQYSRVSKKFYLISWSLTAFFLETKNPVFRKFYQDYLSYEQGRSYNDVRSCEDYFKKHLSSDQIRALDREWFQFLLSRSYENI